MKERITYIVRDPINNEFDPSTLAISNSSLAFTKGIDAAKEWQVTVGLGELGERVRVEVFFVSLLWGSGLGRMALLEALYLWTSLSSCWCFV